MGTLGLLTLGACLIVGGLVVYFGNRTLRKERGKLVEEHVKIAELANENGVVPSTRFVGCTIVGPAVLVPQSDFNLSYNTIEGDPDAFLWTIEEGRDRVVGAVAVMDCSFRACTFKNIGIAAPAIVTEQLRESIAGKDG